MRGESGVPCVSLFDCCMRVWVSVAAAVFAPHCANPFTILFVPCTILSLSAAVFAGATAASEYLVTVAATTQGSVALALTAQGLSRLADRGTNCFIQADWCAKLSLFVATCPFVGRLAPAPRMHPSFSSCVRFAAGNALAAPSPAAFEAVQYSPDKPAVVVSRAPQQPVSSLCSWLSVRCLCAFAHISLRLSDVPVRTSRCHVLS